jgi:hypothetical protein
MKPREVVFDTNVLVAAFRSRRGASHELVRLIGTGAGRTISEGGRDRQSTEHFS